MRSPWLLRLLFIVACIAGVAVVLGRVFVLPAQEPPVEGLVEKPGADAARYELADFAPTADHREMKGGWLLSFDGSRRVPRWTLERLTARSFGDAKRGDTKFHKDTLIPKEFASDPDDFNGFTTIYDRFHLAACGNHTDSAEHVHETFTIANAGPGAKKLNENLWRHLEDHVRELAAGRTIVWVATMPLWAPEGYPESLESRDARYVSKSIGTNHQEVPTHWGKSVLVQQGAGLSVSSWIVPNDDDAIEGHEFDDYLATTDDLESLAGIDLWKDLPQPLQDRLEGVK